jgi:NAD(P)-dependent dehydrogenase (short-subunit alcohol dehydrogenase family)
MDVLLTGQVVVVTGASQGVGEAIARLAAAAGAAGLVLTGRDGPKGQRVAEALGLPAIFVADDLADPAAPGRIADAALARFGRIDGLVNAAGLTDRGSMLTGDAALWDRLFAVNARAPFLLMQAAIRDMGRRRAGGSIVNVLSMNAYCGTPELAVYSASKGALATLTKNAANAHLADRIRVNGIMMGWAASPGEERMQAETLGKGPDWAAAVAAGQPLGRLLTLDEVARLAVFLLSPASGLMTGALVDLEQKVVGA